MYRKHSWKPFCESFFSSAAAFLNMSVASQNHGPFIVGFSERKVKISWSQVRRVWGMLQCCHIVLC